MLDTLLSNQMTVAFLNTTTNICAYNLVFCSKCMQYSKANVVATAGEKERATIYRPYGHVREHNKPHRTSWTRPKTTHREPKKRNFENNKRAIISVYACIVCLLLTEPIVHHHHLIIVFMMSAIWAFNNENVSNCVPRVLWHVCVCIVFVTMTGFCYYFFTIVSIGLDGSTVNLSSKDSLNGQYRIVRLWFSKL